MKYILKQIFKKINPMKAAKSVCINSPIIWDREGRWKEDITVIHIIRKKQKRYIIFMEYIQSLHKITPTL